MMLTNNRLIRLLFLVLGTLFVGTLGYMLLEGWSISDALYMTAITLSTVGFGEVEELSSSGRIFTVLLIFLGVGVIVYSFSFIAEYVVSINMVDEIRKRRVKNMPKKFKDHVIICGYGRVGRSTARALQESQRQIVIIDSDPTRIVQALEAGFVALEGDASQDELLHESGLAKAWGIIVTTGQDSLNLFIVLSARTINPELFIIARANQANNEVKLQRAGANRVVSPYQIGGQHMANIVVRPHVTDFFDVVTLKGGEELWIEEFVISAGCPLDGRTVGEANIRQQTGVTLVALYRRKAEANIVPDANTRLEARDELIVLGKRDQLAALEALTNPISQ
ncbi:MAG: potassium channel protein [Anaerolineaceae bacterium]|nr:MAG: potassium channel protein [Anaerolineaceae bacterium]